MKKDALIATAFSAFMLGVANASEVKKTTNVPSKKAEVVRPKKAEVVRGKCFGINACKAKGECATKTNTCHYKNSCKGKGWLSKTQKECQDLKGTFEI